MAKKRARMDIGLVCEVCKTQNYVTEKNKINSQEPLNFNKYCSTCKKHTNHKEKKKLD
ncbi:MAG: 50S ribosomal protein L33 [Weeksellaceae bacterium]